MYLIGNVNVENLTFDSTGLVDPERVEFVLPSRLRGRHQLRVKYFGYHSGTPYDLVDTQLERDDADRAAMAPYAWRGSLKEVRMGVEVDGSNIMRDSVVRKRASNLNDTVVEAEYSVDYLTYPAVKQTDALRHDGVSALVNNNTFLPLAVHRGYSKLQDIGLGFVEENASKIDVIITAENLSMKDASTAAVSGERNVRMDTISFVLELL